MDEIYFRCVVRCFFSAWMCVLKRLSRELFIFRGVFFENERNEMFFFFGI